MGIQTRNKTSYLASVVRLEKQPLLTDLLKIHGRSCGMNKMTEALGASQGQLILSRAEQ